jgi:hypothetical protein
MPSPMIGTFFCCRGIHFLFPPHPNLGYAVSLPVGEKEHSIAHAGLVISGQGRQT